MRKPVAFVILVVLVTAMSPWSAKGQQFAKQVETRMPGPEQDALQVIKDGRQLFRFDTFGNEEFWGDPLKLHQAFAG